jgi:hypothetical protein
MTFPIQGHLKELFELVFLIFLNGRYNTTGLTLGCWRLGNDSRIIDK